MLIGKRKKPTAMRLLVLDYLPKYSAATAIINLEKEFQPVNNVALCRWVNTFEEQSIVQNIPTVQMRQVCPLERSG